MKLKDIISDEYVEIFELNRGISAPTMYGAMLYKGNGVLLHSAILDKEVFRIFDGYRLTIIVY
jgi:hypothetical protein